MLTADAADASPSIWTDMSRWPVVLITLPKAVTDDQLADLIVHTARMKKDRPGMYALVLDLRKTEAVSPTQRKMLTDSMEKLDGESAPDRCAGVALVFSSQVLRGVLTAIFWVRRPACPCSVFTDRGDALVWALGVARSDPKSPDAT